MNNTFVYALDFDGVICDSAVETGITGWKAAAKIWTDMPPTPPQDAVDSFRQLRPIIETGYESILAMRLLYLGESVDGIYQGFAAKVASLLEDGQVTVADLKKLFGETRDAWIAADLPGWIAMNPLFEGVAEKLRTLKPDTPWYVVTTKQERFVKHIFQAKAVELADGRIFGLDRAMGKAEVLKELAKNHPGHPLYFLEDRLPTLVTVQKDPELAQVKLVFALWGYNTAGDKAQAAQHGFTLQALGDFLQP